MSTPQVKIKFGADTTGLKKGVNSAKSSLDSFGSTLKKIAGIAGIAFGAQAIVNFGKATVQAAAAEEKSQALLATTLRNTTKATDTQITAVEDYISRLEMASGVVDDKLRPSLQILLNSTKSVTKAQTLQGLALDISAGSTRDLESVSLALSKAVGGNLTALTRLGIPLDKAAVKSGDLQTILKQLAATYGGSAATRAKTFSGQMDRMSIMFDHLKESIGAKVIPILTTLFAWINDKLLPAFKNFYNTNKDKIMAFWNTMKTVWGGIVSVITTVYNFIKPIFDAFVWAFDYLGQKVRDNKKSFEGFANALSGIFSWVKKYILPLLSKTFVGTFKTLVKVLGYVIKPMAKLFEFLAKTTLGQINIFIKGINLLIKAYNLFADKPVDLVPEIKMGNFKIDEFTQQMDDAAKKIDDTTKTTQDTGPLGNYTTGLKDLGTAAANAKTQISELDKAIAISKINQAEAAKRVQENLQNQYSEALQNQAKQTNADVYAQQTAAATALAPIIPTSTNAMGAVARGEYSNSANQYQQPINVTINSPIADNSDQLAQWVNDTINRKLRTGATLYSAY